MSKDCVCVARGLLLTAFYVPLSHSVNSYIFVYRIMGFPSPLHSAILENIQATGDSNDKILFSYIRKEHCHRGSAA